AYVHPRAVQVFERQWLVNLILWGNYPRLSESALNELGDELPGTTLQGACVYGGLTERPCARARGPPRGRDIAGVVPIPREDLRHEFPAAGAGAVGADELRGSGDAGRLLRPRAGVLPAARAAAPRARAHACRGRPRGEARRQDRRGRLRAAALVESAALRMGPGAGADRAVRARPMAQRRGGLAAGGVPRAPAPAVDLRRPLSGAGDFDRRIVRHCEERPAFARCASYGAL